MAINQKRIRDALLTMALQPRKLAKSLSGLTAGNLSQGLTVISLDGQWLKLLHVEGPGLSRRITKAFACPIEGSSPEEIEKLFKETCATEGVLLRDVLVANPTHLCTVRIFSLPSTDPKEIRDIVDLQAEKHTPYAKEEILTDFKVIDRERSGYSRVLLVIAHQDVIHRSVRLVERAGGALERVGCELEGLVNWFHLVKGSAGAKGTAGASLVVEVDGGTTTLLVVSRGQPQFHRSLATGAEHLEEDFAHAGERLVGELQRSIEGVDAEAGGTKIETVLLTGKSERLIELKALIEQGLGLPVTLISPWEGRTALDAVRASWEQLPDVSFASLVGLACAPNQIDLTPPTTKLRQAFEARARALVLLGCQCVGVLILISLLIIGRAQKEQRYYTKLRSTYEQGAQEAFQVEDGLRQLQFVKERLRQQGQALSIVELLATHSPPEIRWESFTYTDGEGVILKGVSTALPKVYEFVAALDGTPPFGKVETRRVAKGKGEEEGVTNFEIVCPLTGAKPAS